MNQQAPSPRLPNWGPDSLYSKLAEIFPSRRTRLNNFDIPWFAREMGKTEEAIYKWLRLDNLRSMANLRAIVALAGREENRAALARAGREPPTEAEFLIFV